MGSREKLQRIIMAIRDWQSIFRNVGMTAEAWDIAYPEFKDWSMERLNQEYQLRLGEYLLEIGGRLAVDSMLGR